MNNSGAKNAKIPFYVKKIYHMARVTPRILLGWLIDRRLNIETSPFEFFSNPDPVDTESGDAVIYLPTRYRSIDRLLAMLPMDSQAVFYDIGAGMGRVTCVAVRLPVRKVVGVEYSAALCAIARNNAARLRGRLSAVEIIEGDAARVDYRDGTVFWLFNPFGEITTRAFLAQLKKSLDQNPRPITILLLNAEQAHCFEKCEWLTAFAKVSDMPEGPAIIWKNRN